MSYDGLIRHVDSEESISKKLKHNESEPSSPTFSNVADAIRHNKLINYTQAIDDRVKAAQAQKGDTQSVASNNLSNLTSGSARSISSIASFASTIDADKTYLNERIGAMIEYALYQQDIAQDYIQLKTRITETNINKMKQLNKIIADADSFIANSSNADANAGKEILVKINSQLGKTTDNHTLNEYLKLLKHRVNLSIQTLKVKAWQSQQQPAAPSTSAKQDGPLSDPVNQAVSAVGAAFEIASMLFSNLIASARILKRAAIKVGKDAVDAHNDIITKAEEAIFEIMVGPGPGPSDAKSNISNTTQIFIDGKIKNQLSKYTQDAIPKLADKVKNHLTAVVDPATLDLSDLLVEAKADTEIKTFLNQGYDALFMFMEYMRQEDAPELSPDVIATMIQLLSVNGEIVALESKPSLEGAYMNVAKSDVPPDEELTQDDSPNANIFSSRLKPYSNVGLPPGGRMRTKKRGARRSVKKHQKKPKGVRGRKTRRAKSQTKK